MALRQVEAGYISYMQTEPDPEAGEWSPPTLQSDTLYTVK